MIKDYLLLSNSIKGIFYATLVTFFLPFITNASRRLLFLVLSIVLILAVGLLFSGNRSGWLGCLSGIAFIIYINIKVRRAKKLFVKRAFISLTIAFVCFAFFYKTESSAGRKYIYSISAEMLKKNWVSGVGFGKFKGMFNEYQANYFVFHDIDSRRALLADNTFYAFNDYLQWGIETGIAGVFAMLLSLYLLIRRIRWLQRKYENKKILVASAATLICIGVAALFSYPLQIIPIQTIVLICIGIILFHPGSRQKAENRVGFRITWLFRTLFCGLACIFIVSSMRVMQRKAGVKEAFELAITGYKKQALAKYEELIMRFPKHGDIIYLYAEQLYYTNRLHEALSAIKEAKKYYVDNKVYSLEAKIEDELDLREEAENSYLRAVYMVPNRMRSRFDLLNYYLNQRDTMKAVYWANSILGMPVKIPSEITANLQGQTKKILLKIDVQGHQLMKKKER